MNDIMAILKEKNNLTTTADGKVVIVPVSAYEFRTSPLHEGEEALLVTAEAYIGLLLRLYRFDAALKNIVPFDNENFGAFMRRKMNARTAQEE